MNCPFCLRELTKHDVEMWGSFNCPDCHKLLRVRRNYPLRILRLVLFTAAPMTALWFVSSLAHHHFGISLTVTAATVGAIDEYVMRIFPATIEPGAAGGLGVS